ncbi:class I SAM-dependent methyltransferase [Edwardsiella ictaluri]|uniref:Uncharacterized protein n=1 Tax=Edwardsiella ictaluri (strain 93-146) TaxID=634503 RepID=C5BE50_EDWI9|nr:class I SAM-dependent methyltransferase [Edwardsiella ictaluri]ACR69291.1 hypothetical protein NT01EI_2115 [Edwardsiella ictaluri 93-146]ARD38533.1 hypothetical protein B6E78_03175 [Edwardsiella ictaluri]UCQ46378.1 class I SAM-dependent methyltransferase [Edwardsiella ictaluri]UCQ49647.1 class I SAM-dependent methyltransferase [Edwardsiella ictaluri]UYB60372.1 class I SAM-dependent methyltransferase [Edwardsiella ictaluri]
MDWQPRFPAAWPQREENDATRLCRIFNDYLTACAGAFRVRDIQRWQDRFYHRDLWGICAVR